MKHSVMLTIASLLSIPLMTMMSSVVFIKFIFKPLFSNSNLAVCAKLDP